MSSQSKSTTRASPPGEPDGPPQSKRSSLAEPVVRNALRYSISSREYATLHKYIISRSRLLRRTAPSVGAAEKMIDGDRSPSPMATGVKDNAAAAAGAGAGSGGYNARAVRHATRVFLTTSLLMKAYDIVTRRMSGADKDPNTGKKQPLHKSPTFRLSLSLSTILLLYRILFRFLTRLRVHLLDSSAAPFRARNPRTSATLTSPYAPAIGASFAGLMLGIYPAKQLRVSIAIYAAFRALEFGWNMSEEKGLVWGVKAGGKGKRERPWWFGSWMLQPFVFGQLLHAVVFDRDCFPMAYGKFIFGNSTAYLHARPKNYPAHIKWPKTYEVVDKLAEMARRNWPPYVSPTLFPDKETLPAALSAVSPLTSQAHPLITSLSCAALHPSDPSCLRTYLTFWLRSFPPLARFFLIFYSALTFIPKYKFLYHSPVKALNRVISRALSMSIFATGSISTAWASICFFQTWFPRNFLATQRFFLGGFLAGLWAWVERRHGRGVFLYSARVSVDSLWKVGVKRRWWRGMKGGDVWLFVLAMMITGVVYERDAKAIKEGSWRKGVSWVRGEGFRDWSVEEDELVDDEGQGKVRISEDTKDARP